MNNRFIAVDFEMANNNLASICQLGFAVFENFELVSQWETLVNPQSEFGYYQTRIHKLTAEDVRDAPTMFDLKEQVLEMINGQVICSYGMNDFHALSGNYSLPDCKWMDASKVIKRVWPELPKDQRNLRAVCNAKNIDFGNHHNALADAIAAGQLMNSAMLEKKLSVNDLLKFSMKHVQIDLI